MDGVVVDELCSAEMLSGVAVVVRGVSMVVVVSFVVLLIDMVVVVVESFEVVDVVEVEMFEVVDESQRNWCGVRTNEQLKE